VVGYTDIFPPRQVFRHTPGTRPGLQILPQLKQNLLAFASNLNPGQALRRFFCLTFLTKKVKQKLKLLCVLHVILANITNLNNFMPAIMLSATE